MKNIEEINRTVILSVAKNLGWVGLVVLLFVLTAGTVQAGEIRFTLDGSGFVNDTLSNGQSFEAFRFDLPQIPQGARLDYVGMTLYIDRPPVDLKDTSASPYFPLKFLPITSDWTPSSLRNGQVLTVDQARYSWAVADFSMGDRVELNITHFVSDWLSGKRANRGFMLAPESAEEKTDFAVKSNAGAKVEVVIYYTGPEVVKE